MKWLKGIFKLCLALIGIIIGVLLIFIIVVAVNSPGTVEPLKDEEGNVMRGSIAKKVKVELNGTTMGMIIRSKDINNPVLLFLHGGPGMPQYFMEKQYPTGLEDDFTIVYWDQRGAGLSYSSSIDASTMNTAQFIDDTIAVTNYLREEFGQDKIYLMAHSFGSYIGIQVAKKAPELYKAYIGVAQVSNQEESERLCHDYLLDYYQSIGKTSYVKQLSKYSSDSDYYDHHRDTYMHQAGVATTRDMKSVITGIFFPSLFCKDYTFMEKINLWRGKITSSHLIHTTDLTKEITSLDLPCYFFSGAYDYNVNYQLSKEFASNITAPINNFYLFENSAHSPIYEEPERVHEIIEQEILPATN